MFHVKHGSTGGSQSGGSAARYTSFRPLFRGAGLQPAGPIGNLSPNGGSAPLLHKLFVHPRRWAAWQPPLARCIPAPQTSLSGGSADLLHKLCPPPAAYRPPAYRLKRGQRTGNPCGVEPQYQGYPPGGRVVRRNWGGSLKWCGGTRSRGTPILMGQCSIAILRQHLRLVSPLSHTMTIAEVEAGKGRTKR